MRNSDADALSVYGVLHLSAANAAAAVYDRATTESLLARAREIAECTGEGNRMGTIMWRELTPALTGDGGNREEAAAGTLPCLSRPAS